MQQISEYLLCVSPTPATTFSHIKGPSQELSISDKFIWKPYPGETHPKQPFPTLRTSSTFPIFSVDMSIDLLDVVL